MTPPIKPSSIVQTREQVEAMAAIHEQLANANPGTLTPHSIYRETAAMLRELAGSVPVSELESFISDHFRSIDVYGGDFTELSDHRMGQVNGQMDVLSDLRHLINQHRAST